MKTRILKGIISGCAFICLICSVAVISPVKAQDLTSKYYYDNNGVSSQPPCRTICKRDDSGQNIVPYLKCFFTYDDRGRVTTRKTHRWHAHSQSWKPAFSMVVKYDDSSVTVDYARWTKKEKEYTLKRERFIYNLDGSKIVSLSCFNRSPKSEEWILTTTIAELQMDLSQVFDGFLVN